MKEANLTRGQRDYCCSKMNLLNKDPFVEFITTKLIKEAMEKIQP
jgi:hypothetical protein